MFRSDLPPGVVDLAYRRQLERLVRAFDQNFVEHVEQLRGCNKRKAKLNRLVPRVKRKRSR